MVAAKLLNVDLSVVIRANQSFFSRFISNGDPKKCIVLAHVALKAKKLAISFGIVAEREL